jgi:hypothetical protein
MRLVSHGMSLQWCSRRRSSIGTVRGFAYSGGGNPGKPSKGKALTVLAPKLARAVYDLLKRVPLLIWTGFSPSDGAEQASLPPHGPPTGSA